MKPLLHEPEKEFGQEPSGYEPKFCSALRPPQTVAKTAGLLAAMSLQRRRRRAPGEDEEAVAAEGSEDELRGPVGAPHELGPGPTRLFSPEKLQGLEEVRRQAPHLYGENRSGNTKDLVLSGKPVVIPERPAFLQGEEMKAPQTSTTTGTPSPGVRQGEAPLVAADGSGVTRRIPEERPGEEDDGQLALAVGLLDDEAPGDQENLLVARIRPGAHAVPGPGDGMSEGQTPMMMTPLPHGQGQGGSSGFDPNMVVQQQLLTLFEALRQENRDLRDELRDQRIGFETQVKALQKQIESQAYRTPESQPEQREGPAQYQRFECAEQERKKLYEPTPMQHFEQMQSMMGHTTPLRPRGTRGRTAGERSRSAGPRPDGKGFVGLGWKPTSLRGPSTTTTVPTARSQGTGKGMSNAQKGAGGSGTTTAPVEGDANGMMDTMAKLVNYLVAKEQKEEGPEAVKPGTITLPMLREPMDTAPIDPADWLTVIEPGMTDLSDSSGQWWELVVGEARQWYNKYIQLRPLQRTTYTIEPWAELKKVKWTRVEKRAISMMLTAVLTTVKEELVATRSLTPLRLLSKLMVLYQPGGVHA